MWFRRLLHVSGNINVSLVKLRNFWEQTGGANQGLTRQCMVVVNGLERREFINGIRIEEKVSWQSWKRKREKGIGEYLRQRWYVGFELNIWSIMFVWIRGTFGNEVEFPLHKKTHLYSFANINQLMLFFTFTWPCIIRNFFVIKPTVGTNFTNLFCHETVHVSDSSSVHHQEFIHCTLSNGICHTGL